ncbi:MAG: uroporphyrinogen synthase [Pseudomonadota bacterium]|jgi:uroporphyrinogen-III synthase
MRVLVTRPDPGAERTVSRLAALGHRALALPLFVVAHRLHNANSLTRYPATALIVTSAEAFRAITPFRADIAPLLRLPLFAVGPATAKAALDFGFLNIIAGSSGGAALAEKIIQESAVRPETTRLLLYLAGDPRTPDLERRLTDASLTLVTEIVYEMQPVAISETEMHRILADFMPEAVLFYSAQAARQFFRLASDHRTLIMLKNMTFLCLSHTIAAVVPQSFQAQVEIALHSDEDSMINLLSHE